MKRSGSKKKRGLAYIRANRIVRTSTPAVPQEGAVWFCIYEGLRFYTKVKWSQVTTPRLGNAQIPSN